MVRRWIRPALWVLVLSPIAWMIARGVMGDLGANPIERLEGETGRWTLRLLAGSLAVSPLVSLTRWGWLIRERRFLGLAAFAYAVLHLNVYIGLDNFFDVDDIVIPGCLCAMVHASCSTTPSPHSALSSFLLMYAPTCQ